MVGGVVARGLAVACAIEGGFYCWQAKQRRHLSQRLPLYDDTERSPSGRPFTYERRRREVRRLLEQEFGVDNESVGAPLGRTPERGKRWISGWFFDTPYHEIDHAMIRTFLAWAWFNHVHASELSEVASAEVEADITAIEAAAGQSFRAPPSPPPSQGEQPQPVEPQLSQDRRRSKGLTSMRPNVDNTAPFHAHHPLLFYFLTQFLIGTVRQRQVLSSLGFERATIQVDGADSQGEGAKRVSFSYWHRPARSKEDGGGDKASNREVETDLAPIVLYHGIGLGWGHSYPPLLRDLVTAADEAPGGRPIFAVELPHVSLTVPTDYGPSPADAVTATCTMLRRHGVGPGQATRRADFLGHSYGSVAVTHVLKQCPECVRSAALVDPVCVGAHRATLCRTFLYDPLDSRPSSSAPMTVRQRPQLYERFMGWFLHSDPRLVGVLMRNFLWFENVLWLDDEEIDAGALGGATTEGGAEDAGDGQIALFVAEGDRYLDGRTIYEDAQRAIERRRRQRGSEGDNKAGGTARRTLRAVLWGNGQDHGEWLGREEQRREVIEVVTRRSSRASWTRG